MKFNFNKLKGKIKEVYGTQNDFATAIDIAPNTLSQKLNNQYDFSSEEIIKSVEALNIKSGTEAWELFFTKEVENISTNKK